jgi:predicted DNA-binding transcriptional regulator AlpA
MIDQTLVADGILFAIRRDRALYIRTLVKDRPQWLKENAGKWRRVQDIQQEAGPLQALVEREITIGARRYANARRVASLLGVSLRTLSRWDAAGTGPPKIKIGKKVFYDLSKISEWLASREIPTTRVTGQN